MSSAKLYVNKLIDVFNSDVGEWNIGAVVEAREDGQVRIHCYGWPKDSDVILPRHSTFIASLNEHTTPCLFLECHCLSILPRTAISCCYTSLMHNGSLFLSTTSGIYEHNIEQSVCKCICSFMGSIAIDMSNSSLYVLDYGQFCIIDLNKGILSCKRPKYNDDLMNIIASFVIDKILHVFCRDADDNKLIHLFYDQRNNCFTSGRLCVLSASGI